MPRRAAARASPWPKLPLEVATTAAGRGSSAAITASVPRPLKERIGFSVSTFSRQAQPSASSSAPCRIAGEIEEHRVDRGPGGENLLRRDGRCLRVHGSSPG